MWFYLYRGKMGFSEVNMKLMLKSSNIACFLRRKHEVREMIGNTSISENIDVDAMMKQLTRVSKNVKYDDSTIMIWRQEHGNAVVL